MGLEQGVEPFPVFEAYESLILHAFWHVSASFGADSIQLAIFIHFSLSSVSRFLSSQVIQVPGCSQISCSDSLELASKAVARLH